MAVDLLMQIAPDTSGAHSVPDQVNTLAELSAVDPAGRKHFDTIEVLTGTNAGVYRPDEANNGWIKHHGGGVGNITAENATFTNPSTSQPVPTQDGQFWFTSDTSDLFISQNGVWIDV